nr:hypothetical protein [Pasteuria penetrans]
MSVKRQDAWTEEDDMELARVTLRHIEEGGTQLSAFEEVARKLGRTPAACGFRWNSSVRKSFETAIQIAKAKRQKRAISRNNSRMHHNYSSRLGMDIDLNMENSHGRGLGSEVRLSGNNSRDSRDIRNTHRDVGRNELLEVGQDDSPSSLDQIIRLLRQHRNELQTLRRLHRQLNRELEDRTLQVERLERENDTMRNQLRSLHDNYRSVSDDHRTLLMKLVDRERNRQQDLPMFQESSPRPGTSSPSAVLRDPSLRDGGIREGMRDSSTRDGGIREGMRDNGMRDGGIREGMRDSGMRDGGIREGMRDSGMRDGGIREGMRDSGMRDGGIREGMRDSSMRDGGIREGMRDSGMRDGGIREDMRDNGMRDGGIREDMRDNGMRDGGIREGMRDSGMRDGGIREDMRDNGMRDGGIREGMRDSSMRDGGIREDMRDNGMRDGGIRGGMRDNSVVSPLPTSADLDSNESQSRNMLDSLPEGASCPG